MRFLPVFLDLKAGPVVLIGAGELLCAKLRVLAAAGARIRVHAIDGNRDFGRGRGAHRNRDGRSADR